jgi:hypothetical protein
MKVFVANVNSKTKTFKLQNIQKQNMASEYGNLWSLFDSYLEVVINIYLYIEVEPKPGWFQDDNLKISICMTNNWNSLYL